MWAGIETRKLCHHLEYGLDTEFECDKTKTPEALRINAPTAAATYGIGKG